MLGTDASVPVVATYPQHPVTKNFDLLTAFPLAQSVKGEAGAELGTANTQNLLKTSDRSWSESDVKSLAAGGRCRWTKRPATTGPDHDRVVAVDGCARRSRLRG